MSELRGLGMSLDQTHHAGQQPNSRNMLVLVSVALFAVAGTAGTFLAFGQRGAPPAAVAAADEATQAVLSTAAEPAAEEPAPVIADFAFGIAPVAAPAPVVAIIEPEPEPEPEPLPVVAVAEPAPATPEVDIVETLPAATAERRITVAEYIATLQELGVELPSASVVAPAAAPAAAPAVAPEAPQEVAFNDLTPTTDVASDVDCIATLDAQAASLVVPFGPSAVTTPNDDLRPVFDLARRVLNCEGAYLVVAGHADPTGNETQNLVLSWQRAEFVADTLTSAGFDANRVEAIGFGSRRPISEGDAGGDAVLNRRVDFVVRAAQP